MPSEDINKIRKILEHKKLYHLADLLKFSNSKVEQSSSYGKYYNSFLATFEIYSPVKTYYELKNLSEDEYNEIFSIVLDLYPLREDVVEINRVRFFLDDDLEISSNEDQSEKPILFYPEIKENYDIFVSHSHIDYVQVKELVDTLKVYGLSVFLAHRDIQPTTEWETEILQVLNSTKVFIAYITPEFKDSFWCDQESGIAFSREEKIIPIIASTNVVPYGFVGKYQGLRIPTAEKQSMNHINTSVDKLSVQIVKALCNDPKTKDFTKERIFHQIKEINSYHQTDLIFSVLEEIEPLLRFIIEISILKQIPKEDPLTYQIFSI